MAADAADAADAAAAAAAVATGDKQPPPRNEQKEASLALTVENIVDLLDGERAKNVEVIEATRPNSLCRFIVVASPHNARHERALTLAIYKRFCKPHNLRSPNPKKIDNYGRWFLYDFGSIVVHVMDETLREKYDFEKLQTDDDEADLSWLDYSRVPNSK